MKIRAATKEDFPAILAIQGENAKAAHWVQQDYEKLAESGGGLLLVAEADAPASPKVIGFAALDRVIDEAELKNLAVATEHQHQGVGQALLREALARLRQAATQRVYLEVRPSNIFAVQLYASLGFVIHSRRKDYYSQPAEDAFVMALDLSPQLAEKQP